MTLDIQNIKQRFEIIGTDPNLDRAIEKAMRVSPTDISVLITGESGVGKEIFPKIIHQLSHRKHNKFIAVNCGAIPEGTIDSELFGHEKGAFTGATSTRSGYFEVADGGTIFLDEVGELPMTTQVRLLRVLENGEFIKVGSSKVQKTNVRIVAATNVNMDSAIQKNKFREDLYYRLSTIEINIPPLRKRKNDLIDRITSELNLTEENILENSNLNGVEELPDAVNQEDLLDKKKQEREKLGSVNLKADEETDKYETEIKKMESDRADLVTAIVKLKDSINELNQKGRERLVEAFEKVNRKFNEVYTQLFNGGSAKLELVDSEDPLEAGLEMLVSPPGKRLQSITLLSGGEQALTALSLIFAVFLTNPSPICVLDEVDAPLDDANVTRFCNLLDELTRITNTRFIIVTHHALTMSKMDRLYGVTMPEKGISQLVAVDLQKAESMVA